MAKPLSLYPAAIIGTAMMARGGIGFLIISVVESQGIFAHSDADGAQAGSSEICLVAVWAMTLCTVLGPIAVGMLVRRVRVFQKRDHHQSNARLDPLGIWGIECRLLSRK